MQRRHLLQAALALPFAAARAARAQDSGKRHRIGVLMVGASGGTGNVPVFFDGLRELGYVEGRNLVVERRFAATDDALEALARELVKLDVEVIVAGGPTATRAARAATSTVPIVMGTHDPVEQGLIASLARPGGNVTGWCVLSVDSASKQFALLKEAVPRLARVGLIANPQMAAHATRMGHLTAAARDLGLHVVPIEVSSREAIAPGFQALRRERVDAFTVIPEPQLDAMSSEIVKHAAEHRLPGMYTWKLYVNAGGLMSYGPSLPAMMRLWAPYVDKILRGTRPGDLPVETPRKYELILNQRAAHALGFTFPSALLLAADEVMT